MPPEFRATWSTAATAGDVFDIFQIEVIGPALTLHEFKQAFVQNALRIRHIDNDAALATPEPLAARTEAQKACDAAGVARPPATVAIAIPE